MTEYEESAIADAEQGDVFMSPADDDGNTILYVYVHSCEIPFRDSIVVKRHLLCSKRMIEQSLASKYSAGTFVTNNFVYKISR